MPERVNSLSDIGTAKVSSDSYDVDNIFLTDQGWVYRHWKGDPATTDRYWDEIIVAGETDPNRPLPNVYPSTPVTRTLYVPGPGNAPYPKTISNLEDGDDNFDVEYSVEYGASPAEGTARYTSYDQYPPFPTPAEGPVKIDPPAGDTQPDGSIQYEGGQSKTFTATYTGAGTSPVYSWTSTGVATVTSGADTASATVDITYTPGGSNSGTVKCVITADLDDGSTDTAESTTKVSASNPIKITNFGTVTGEATPDVNDTETYSVTGLDVSNGADDIVYSWASAGGTIQGSTSGSTVSVNWPTGGNWNVSLNVSSVKAEVTGQASAPLNVVVNDGTVDDPVILDGVTITKTSTGTTFNGDPVDYRATIATNNNSGPSGAVTATWSVTPSDGVTIEGNNTTTPRITFPLHTNSNGLGSQYDVKVSVYDTNSGGQSNTVEDTVSVTVNQKLVEALLQPGSDDTKYVVSGSNGAGDNATITINQYDKLNINNNTSGHPVHIVTATGAADVATNAVDAATISGDGQGATGPSETITWDTSTITPGTYYYQCGSHDAMNGEIVVVTAI